MLILASARASAKRARVPGRLSRKIASCFVISIDHLLNFENPPLLRFTIADLLLSANRELAGASRGAWMQLGTFCVSLRRWVWKKQEDGESQAFSFCRPRCLCSLP